MQYIIYSNFNREEDVGVVDNVIKILSDRKLPFELASYRENNVLGHSFIRLRDILASDDVVIVIGGDGTILRATEDIAYRGFNTPILAINRGECGFLTDVEPNEAEFAIDKVINKDYKIDSRSILKVTYKDNSYFALNEFVLYKGTISCPIISNVSLSTGESVMTVHSDGAYISTPTGSTAYSLSAGASILAPETKAFVVGAICAHSLLNKSMIVPDDKKFIVRLGRENSSAKIMVDGVIVDSVYDNTPISVEKADISINFIKTKEVDFYKKLDDKLSRWSDLMKFFKDTQQE